MIFLPEDILISIFEFLGSKYISYPLESLIDKKVIMSYIHDDAINNKIPLYDHDTIQKLYLSRIEKIYTYTDSKYNDIKKHIEHISLRTDSIDFTEINKAKIKISKDAEKDIMIFLYSNGYAISTIQRLKNDVIITIMNNDLIPFNTVISSMCQMYNKYLYGYINESSFDSNCLLGHNLALLNSHIRGINIDKKYTRISNISYISSMSNISNIPYVKYYIRQKERIKSINKPSKLKYYSLCMKLLKDEVLVNISSTSFNEYMIILASNSLHLDICKTYDLNNISYIAGVNYLKFNEENKYYYSCDTKMYYYSITMHKNDAIELTKTYISLLSNMYPDEFYAF